MTDAEGGPFLLAETTRRTHHNVDSETRRSIPRSATLPAALAPGVLGVEPFLQRREVVEQRRGVHGALARERLQRVLPGTRGPQREQRAQALAGGLVAMDRAGMEGT